MSLHPDAIGFFRTAKSWLGIAEGIPKDNRVPEEHRAEFACLVITVAEMLAKYVLMRYDTGTSLRSLGTTYSHSIKGLYARISELKNLPAVVATDMRAIEKFVMPYLPLLEKPPSATNLDRGSNTLKYAWDDIDPHQNEWPHDWLSSQEAHNFLVTAVPLLRNVINHEEPEVLP